MTYESKLGCYNQLNDLYFLPIIFPFKIACFTIATQSTTNSEKNRVISNLLRYFCRLLFPEYI